MKEDDLTNLFKLKILMRKSFKRSEHFFKAHADIRYRELWLQFLHTLMTL